MSAVMTEEEFAQKVQREGGVLDALEYGLRAKDVAPGELHNDWSTLEDQYDAMTDILWSVEGQIEELAEAP